MSTSYENGSCNYQNAINNGWVVGNAQYAEIVPHHGPGFVYQSMYHQGEEENFTALFRTENPVSFEVTCSYYAPKGMDEGDENYWEAGTWKIIDGQDVEHDVPPNCELIGNNDPVLWDDEKGIWRQDCIVERRGDVT